MGVKPKKRGRPPTGGITCTRTTISVPNELYRRMKKCNKQVNWSALAAEAFVRFLDGEDQP